MQVLKKVLAALILVLLSPILVTVGAGAAVGFLIVWAYCEMFDGGYSKGGINAKRT
jgi:hypothetical protein